MLGGISTTLLIGLPPLPAPPPLVSALQKIEIEAAMDVASAFRLHLGITQAVPGDWDLLQVQYQETLFRPFTPIQIRVKVGIDIPETIINGYVTGVDAVYDDESGGSALEVSGGSHRGQTPPRGAQRGHESRGLTARPRPHART